MTVGPSAEGNDKTASSGMACHIYAAQDGPSARRIRPDMSIKALKSIDNGIWMCYQHGKIIDTDECTYSPFLLEQWRGLAEVKARIRHEHGADVEIHKTNDPNLFLFGISFLRLS